MSPGPSLKAEVFLSCDDCIVGYVLDASDLQKRFVVELWLDGYPAGLSKAQHYDHALVQSGFGDGCYGFVFALSDSRLAASLAEVRLANSEERVGEPLVLDTISRLYGRRDGGGSVAWMGGLVLSGWIDRTDDKAEGLIRAFADGERVTEIRPLRWKHIMLGDEALPVRGFDIHLPVSFADGIVRQVSVHGPSGAELPGSPCTIVAFADGLKAELLGRGGAGSNLLRAQLYDRLIPRSLPFASFDAWAHAYPLPDAEPSSHRIGVVLIGDEGTEASIESLQAQVGAHWIAAVLANAKCPATFDSADLTAFLEGDAKDCEVIVVALNGAVFEPPALARLAMALHAFPTAPLAYADVAMLDEDGNAWPIAYTAFDYERTLEQGCGTCLFAMTHAKAAEQRSADLFGWFIGAIEAPAQSQQSDHCPVHAPGPLCRVHLPRSADVVHLLQDATAAHLRRVGRKADVARGAGTLFPAVRIRRGGREPSVSVVIPHREHTKQLRECVTALRETTPNRDLEIVIVDNGSGSAEARSALADLQNTGATVLHVPGPMNFSQLVNAGAASARGELTLVLRTDVRAGQSGWLDEMIGRFFETDVGVVGPRLTWPSGVIRSGGVILGPRFSVGSAFDDRFDGDQGYCDALRVAHQCSAVDDSCLLTRRNLFREVGGFDPIRFPSHYGSVDYCLKLGAKGYRVIVTPHAKLTCTGIARDDRASGFDVVDRLERERVSLRSIWGALLLDDPFYSPLLSLEGAPYSGLAMPPRNRAPRLPRSGAPHFVPSGF